MSDFLEAKYKWLFSFFDSDNSGVLERTDFRAKGSRASDAVYQHFQHQPNGQEILRRHFESIKQAQLTAYDKLFEALVQSVDTSGDRKISYNEWVVFCRKVKHDVDQTGRLPKWFEDLLIYYFNHVLDFDRNGKIEFYEMSFMGDAPLEVTWYCFDKLTNSNNIPLDVQLFVEMCKQYMSTSDQGSKSRYIFGFTENQF
ncbi:hypothetical protein GJ496_007949 [Pomphorhynchus laevis]|nr:hypothetical protein GJ496_007949 [Pomphorhynchus laevis]